MFYFLLLRSCFSLLKVWNPCWNLVSPGLFRSWCFGDESLTLTFWIPRHSNGTRRPFLQFQLKLTKSLSHAQRPRPPGKVLFPQCEQQKKGKQSAWAMLNVRQPILHFKKENKEQKHPTKQRSRKRVFFSPTMWHYDKHVVDSTHWQLQRSMHLTMSSNNVGERNTLPEKLLFGWSTTCRLLNSLTAFSSASEKRSIRETWA